MRHYSGFKVEKEFVGFKERKRGRCVEVFFSRIVTIYLCHFVQVREKRERVEISLILCQILVVI